MRRKQFLKELREYCGDNGHEYAWSSKKGKGSHGTVYVNSKKCIVPDADLPRYYVDDILASLGVPKDAI